MPSAAIPTVSTGFSPLAGSLRRVAVVFAAWCAPWQGWCDAWFREPARGPQGSPQATRLQRDELLGMSAHELSDLGIGRSEAPAVLDRPDTWRCSRY